MMLLNTFISVLTLLNGCCNDSIKLELPDKEMQVKTGETNIQFDLKVYSYSENNYLMYGFNDEVETAFWEETDYCKENIVAGIAVFVYNQKMEALHAFIPPIPEDINYKPITAERVQQVIAEEKVRFRSSLQTIKTGESMVFTKKADLKNFRLTQGTYYMKLLYYEGNNILNLVTEDQVAEDTKKHKAEVFKGCVSSNLVKLIVE